MNGIDRLKEVAASARDYFTLDGPVARARTATAEGREEQRALAVAIAERRAEAASAWDTDQDEAIALMKSACAMAGEAPKVGEDLPVVADADLDERAALEALAFERRRRAFGDLGTRALVAEQSARLAAEQEPKLRTILQRRRFGLVLVVALVLTLLAAKRMWPKPQATASAFANPLSRAARALDGDVWFPWLLPDNTTGWLDVRLGRARSVTSVSLHNAVTMAGDRATGDYAVELFDGDQSVAKVTGTFADVPFPDWVHVPIEAARVDRVRVHVLTVRKRGGGLGEVRVH